MLTVDPLESDFLWVPPHRALKEVRGEEEEWARRGKGHHVHIVGNEWPFTGGARDKGVKE